MLQILPPPATLCRRREECDREPHPLNCLCGTALRVRQHRRCRRGADAYTDAKAGTATFNGNTEANVPWFGDTVGNFRLAINAGLARRDYTDEMAAFLERWRSRAGAEGFQYSLIITETPPERALRQFLLARKM